MLAQCAMFESGPPSEAAQRGTRQHEALEQILSGSPQREKCLGLDSDEVEAVAWAAEYVQAHASDGVPLQLEQRVALLDENFEEITFGTADVWAAPDLFDYKSGEIRNYTEQVAAYALMLMERDGLDHVNVHLLYGKYKKAVVTSMDRDTARGIIKGIIDRARDPERKPEPCDYCGWCSKAATCPALQERVGAVAAGRDDWALEQYHSSEITSPEEMGKALTLARQMKAWCESVEFHAKEMAIKQGIKIPGYKVAERAGRRECKNVAAAFPLVGLPQEKFLGACSIQLSKLETEYAEFNGMKKAPAKRALNEKLVDVITQGRSSQFLTKEKE